jgi:hypothetical protein
MEYQTLHYGDIILHGDEYCNYRLWEPVPQWMVGDSVEQYTCHYRRPIKETAPKSQMTKDLDELQNISTKLVKLLEDRQEGILAWLSFLQTNINDMDAWIKRVTGK